MAEKGILHIKLFEYLIEKDDAFGYVQIRDFLLKQFVNHDTEESRVRMKRFLDFMISDGYVEKIGNNEKGIWIHTENGKLVPSTEIYSVIRIKPKAVELLNSYMVNRKNRYGMYISISFAFLALCLSLISISFQHNVDNKSDLNYVLINKVDSLHKEIYILKDSLLKENIQHTSQIQKSQEP